MTLTESLISSFILVGLATQTGHLQEPVPTQ